MGSTAGSPCFQLREEDLAILGNIDSAGSYNMAKAHAKKLPDDMKNYLLQLIDAIWDADCLEKANEPTTLGANYLKALFKKAPSGGLAQKRVIELLLEKDSLD